MDNLTPITREEMLMNDESLTPITREEKILAGEDLNPVTRREYFLKKYRHAGGEVMVEGLEVTANGTYTAPEGKAYSPVEVDVPMPDNAYLLKEASGTLVSFADGADLPMPSFVCDIDAVQDLHGYDGPWVGGSGKNKLPMTVDGIKAANTGGTWNGNSYSYNNVNYTVNTDNDGNVISIKVDSNNNTQNSTLLLYKSDTELPLNAYIMNGCPANGSGSTYRLRAFSVNAASGGDAIMDYGDGADISNSFTVKRVAIIISANYTANNLVFKPMIRLATVTDATFAPYSNICPISGHTGVDAVVSPTTEASAGTTYSVSWQTEAGEVYGGYVDLVSGVLTVTDGYIDLGTCEWLRTDLGNNNYRYYTTKVSNLVKAPSSTSEMPNIECSHYKNKLPSQYNQAVDGITIYTNGSIQVYDSTRSALTTTDFKTAMDGVQLVYELATPITYQLTPTQIKSLLGSNNAWCDTGDVDIEYFGKEV